MSLLDDVSIVVTPNGYKAGTLYGVLPTYAEGSEDVVNGDFASGGTSWNTNTGWTITTGIAESVGATADINQGVWSPNAESQYQVTFEVKTITAGGVRFRFGGVFGATRTEAGVYTEIITTIDTERIRIASVSVDSSYFSGTITNISVKEVTSSDMDVTRATAATRVDENGLVNYAKILGDELVTNGDFATDSDWTLGTGATISNNLLNFDSVNNDNTRQLNLFPTPSLGTYEVSFDISNYVGGHIDLYLGGYQRFDFNANSNGTWKQTCVISNPSSNTIFYFIGDNFTGSIDNVSVKEVTRDNVPRIDYTGGGCPHILAEPQRTNLFEYSESFNESEWSRTSVTVVDNSSQSPDGTNNASLLYPSSSGDYRYMHNSTTASSSTYTISAFVKASGKNVVWFYINSASNNGFIYYDLSDQTTQVVAGSVGTPTATIISYGNDWYKISFTTGTAVALASGSGIGVSDAKGDPAVTTNGTDGVLVWGLQLEAGSYATSYIPTSGSTVTRNQDIFTRDGIGSLINSTEGTLVIEPRYFVNDGSTRKIAISDGTGTNRIYITPYQGLTSRIRYIFTNGGSTQADLQVTGIDITVSRKLAFVWKTNRFELWQNGSKISEDTSGTTPSAGIFNQIHFGSETGNGTTLFEGELKQLQVYNTALTDEQLLQLTGESGTDFYESYAEMASALTYTIQ